MAEKVSTKQVWEAKELATQVVWCKLRCSLGHGSRGCMTWAVVNGRDEWGEEGRTCSSKQGSCHVDLTSCCCVGILIKHC